MKITDALKDFKIAQEKKLPEETFENHLWAIELFEDYLAHYSDVSKTKPDSEFNEVTINGKIDEITPKEYMDFLHVFVIKKVASSSLEMESYLSVLKKFTDWLSDNSALSVEHIISLNDVIAGASSLPKTADISEALFELAKNNVIREYSEIVSGNYKIEQINKYDICIKNIHTDIVYEPILLTPNITEILEKGMILHIEIGKCEEGWVVIEAGNVFLKIIE